MKNRNFLFSLIFLMPWTLSCSRATRSKMYTDTPTSGRIAIAVDESFKPLIDRMLNVFHYTYPDATIDVRYVPEEQAMNDLLFDTIRFAVVGRDLTPYEKYVFDTMGITPRKAKIAKDALCFIVNRANPDSNFSVEQIKKIFEGEISEWRQINPKSKLGRLQVVFDQNRSSNAGMLYRLFIGGNRPFPEWCKAATSNEQVIEYVKKNRNAIGVIGVGWLSDAEDTTHLRFRHEIRVAGISEDSTDYYQPFQAYIATEEYPFVRHIYAISKEARSGLGAGVMAFMARDKGQRIVLKSGLVPATMPVRLVHMRNSHENE